MVTCKKRTRDVTCAYGPVCIGPLRRCGTVMQSWSSLTQSSVCSLLGIYPMCRSANVEFFFSLQKRLVFIISFFLLSPNNHDTHSK